MNNQPLVSIIVPTKNSAQFLEQCLLTIKNQTYSNIELIVVDNNSIDKTKEIAKKYTDKIFNIGPERSSQRNYGVSRAKGEYVAIIDSDMVLTHKVIKECIEEIQKDNQVKQLVIPEMSEGEGFWTKVKAFERSFYIGDPDMEAARFFEKKVFEEVGGYDERMTAGEDYDLAERILARRYKQSRINAFIKHQEGRLTLWETMKTKYYYGKTAGIYIKKQPENARRKIRLFRSSFLRHWPRLLHRPFLSAAMFFMKICEFGAGGIGYFMSAKKV